MIYYRISATNGVGMGLMGDAKEVLTPNTPTFMYAPVNTSVTAT